MMTKGKRRMIRTFLYIIAAAIVLGSIAVGVMLLYCTPYGNALRFALMYIGVIVGNIAVYFFTMWLLSVICVEANLFDEEELKKLMDECDVEETR